MEMVDVTVYYLEMHSLACRTVPAPREGVTVDHVVNPSVAWYRDLYHRVGSDYYWLSRRKMSDEALAQVIGDPQTELHVLKVDGTIAGFAELDCRMAGEIEIVQFGLLPDFIGHGLGKWFLNRMILKAFSHSPRRLWLHTCTLDHPAALPNYLQAGFVLYKEEHIRREL